MEPQKALAELTEGVLQFQREIFPAQRAMFEQLQSGQQPLALFVTCADSRVVPNLFTQHGPGEMFYERNPGALVPAYEPFVGGVTAGLEYAMQVLKVPLVIVCGHTDCGVMKALMNPELADGLPGLQQWMRNSLKARERWLQAPQHGTHEERLRRLTEENVRVQVENVHTHPSVQARFAAGEVEVYGWIYDIGTGRVSQGNRETGAFTVIGK